MVEQLRENGYDVEIIHYRRFPGEKSLVNAGTTGEFRKAQFECKGGLTVVHLIKNGTIHATGQAACSDKDNYNRRLGAKIALGRALKTLKQKLV